MGVGRLPAVAAVGAGRRGRNFGTRRSGYQHQREQTVPTRLESKHK